MYEMRPVYGWAHVVGAGITQPRKEQANPNETVAVKL